MFCYSYEDIFILLCVVVKFSKVGKTGLISSMCRQKFPIGCRTVSHIKTVSCSVILRSDLLTCRAHEILPFGLPNEFLWLLRSTLPFSRPDLSQLQATLACMKYSRNHPFGY